MIGDAMNPVNCLVENENEVGGRVDLGNNQNKKLRLSKQWQIRGKINLAKSKAGGNDDLANNLPKSKDEEVHSNADGMNFKKKGPKIHPVFGADTTIMLSPIDRQLKFENNHLM